MGPARKGVSTVVERIDPGVLADLIIKSTALQEMTNASLREKQSPYRISEVKITASIPPGVTFSISRIDDSEDRDRDDGLVGGPDQTLPATGEAVIALDGTRPEPGAAGRGPERPRERGPEDLNRL